MLENPPDPVRSRNSSNTVIPRGVWTEFPLPSVGSPSTGTHNLRPEQELHKHSEHPRDHDQLPSARSQPQHILPWCLDSPQYVIREHDKAHQRRDLVTVPTIPWTDRDCFFCCTIISERKPDKSNNDVQDVVAQDCPQRQRDSPPRPLRPLRQLENR